MRLKERRALRQRPAGGSDNEECSHQGGCRTGQGCDQQRRRSPWQGGALERRSPDSWRENSSIDRKAAWSRWRPATSIVKHDEQRYISLPQWHRNRLKLRGLPITHPARSNDPQLAHATDFAISASSGFVISASLE